MIRRSVAALLALVCGAACARDTQRAAPTAAGPDAAGTPALASASGPPTGPAPSASSRAGEREGCRVKFTGAEESDFVGMWSPRRKDDKVTAASDYWATDAEVRTALRAGMNEKDPAEAKRKIDERMLRDPRLVILAVTCVGDGGG